MPSLRGDVALKLVNSINFLWIEMVLFVYIQTSFQYLLNGCHFIEHLYRKIYIDCTYMFSG